MRSPIDIHSLVGARIVLESERISRPRRTGIIEQIVASPAPSYRVLWDDGRKSIIMPASGCARIDAVHDGVDTPFLFRSINDSIRRLDSSWADVCDFVCECPDVRCTRVMRLSRREYDAVRAVPGRFAVALGHERSSNERLVTRFEGYVVVERSTL